MSKKKPKTLIETSAELGSALNELWAAIVKEVSQARAFKWLMKKAGRGHA